MRTWIVLLAALAFACVGCKDKKADAPEGKAAAKQASADDEAGDEADDAEEEGVEVRRLGPEGQKVKMIRKPAQVGAEVEGVIQDGVQKRDRQMQP